MRAETARFVKLLKISAALLAISTMDDAIKWQQEFNDWFVRYKPYLDEKSRVKNKNKGNYEIRFTHENTRKAYNSLATRLRNEELFVFLETGCSKYTNGIEGALHAKLRRRIGFHRGLSLARIQRLCQWAILEINAEKTGAKIRPKEFLEEWHYKKDLAKELKSKPKKKKTKSYKVSPTKSGSYWVEM
ncbi:MAG: hypothetical protein QM632_06525 [Micrococcaceae bacterium]